MTNFLDRLRLGLISFKEGYLVSNVIDTTDWSAHDARQLRYNVLWAQYEGTAYRDVHTWATALRKQFALYKYIRPIYNPSYRLGEFWKAHLFGGPLSPTADDGGAIPIETEHEQLRKALALLWKWSRWHVKKDILSVRGAILGDGIIQVVDDVTRGRVYLDLLHPGAVESLDKDAFGNVKGYVLKEARTNPSGGSRAVVYSEQVTREGEDVVYRTYKDGEPFAWPDNIDRTGAPVSEWREPYGFVPLVAIQHNDVGLDWGWSELHAIRAKTQETDDLASQISDQVRKTVNPIWLMRGMKRQTLTITGASDTADSDHPAPGREETNMIWNVPIEGGADAMVAELDFESALLHLGSLLKEIERDVLELSSDIHTASGDASGRALRVARQPVVSKVVQRRANYDAGMVAAQQMAIAIGGFRGYEGYKVFGLESYDKGDLEHSIAERSVFQEDPLDSIEIDAAFWQACEQAGKAGVPIAAYLAEQGWDSERIDKLLVGEGSE